MKKLAILAVIALTSAVVQAKMYVPEGATQEQQDQAVQIEHALQQGNLSSAGVIGYGNAPTSVSTSSSTSSQSSYTKNIGTGNPDFSQSGFFLKNMSVR